MTLTLFTIQAIIFKGMMDRGLNLYSKYKVSTSVFILMSCKLVGWALELIFIHSAIKVEPKENKASWVAGQTWSINNSSQHLI